MTRCHVSFTPSLILLAAVAGVATAHAEDGTNDGPGSPQRVAELAPAFASIRGDNLLEHIKVLASDEYEGRAPGTKGEALTVRYLIGQLSRSGLKPGNPDGSYTQAVPLIGFSTVPSLSVTVNGKQTALSLPDDYVARAQSMQSEFTVASSDLVFAGYGIVAPEYGWDDFKDVDVRGKTLIVLDGEPQVPDPLDASRMDERYFKGEAPTYHGTRPSKFETASRKGAAAVLVIHDPETAYTSFDVIQNNFRREAFDLSSGAKGPTPTAATGWITLEAAQRLSTATGHAFDALKRAASSKSFSAIPLGATASWRFHTALREIESHNVVARLEGSDKSLKNEYVVYTAHWDHLGRDATLDGDQIYNGAIDNAGGVAQLLAIAEGFSALARAPRRSILFIATTAEEKGYLGAKYYVAHPLYPLAQTLADINLDSFNAWGRTTDFYNLGFGLTTLDDVLKQVALSQQRTFIDATFAGGSYFFLSDQVEFAKAGVPALFFGSGSLYVGRPEAYGEEKWNEYGERHYHQVSDEVKVDWELSGAVEDARCLLEVGFRIAQSETRPQWNAGAEFGRRN
jgi:Zn-dependent M28 family amino/carboxypeptidase